VSTIVSSAAQNARPRFECLVEARVDRGCRKSSRPNQSRNYRERRFWAVPPSDATGDVASMSLLAGQAAGLVDRVEPARDVVRRLAEGVERIVRELAGLVR